MKVSEFAKQYAAKHYLDINANNFSYLNPMEVVKEFEKVAFKTRQEKRALSHNIFGQDDNGQLTIKSAFSNAVVEFSIIIATPRTLNDSPNKHRLFSAVSTDSFVSLAHDDSSQKASAAASSIEDDSHGCSYS